MLTQFCQAIGYEFKDDALLTLALSHRSFGKANNERLEFLGDSLVNCIIALALYEKESTATEGELSRMRAALVKGETLALVAAEFSLGDHLHLGPGEIKSGGHKRASILAGALEAVIGAIYLDSDFNTCQQVVLSWFEKRLQATNVSLVEKDPKTQLQEFLQSRKISLPEYVLKHTSGAAHEQTFYVDCVIASLELTVSDQGLSRRKAEQNAAEKMLKELKGDN